MTCPKCNSELYQKVDSIFRSLFLGYAGVKAFPNYYCNNCGIITYRELPEDLRKIAFRWRIIYLISAITIILVLFLL